MEIFFAWLSFSTTQNWISSDRHEMQGSGSFPPKKSNCRKLEEQKKKATYISLSLP